MQQAIAFRKWPAVLLFGPQAGGYWLVAFFTLLGGLSRTTAVDCRANILLWSGAGLLQFLYALAFSARVYHFEALALLFPMASVGLNWLRTCVQEGGVRASWVAVSRRRLSAVFLIFAGLQIEFLLLVRRPGGPSKLHAEVPS